MTEGKARVTFVEKDVRDFGSCNRYFKSRGLLGAWNVKFWVVFGMGLYFFLILRANYAKMLFNKYPA